METLEGAAVCRPLDGCCCLWTPRQLLLCANTVKGCCCASHRTHRLAEADLLDARGAAAAAGRVDCCTESHPLWGLSRLSAHACDVFGWLAVGRLGACPIKLLHMHVFSMHHGSCLVHAAPLLQQASTAAVSWGLRFGMLGFEFCTNVDSVSHGVLCWQFCAASHADVHASSVSAVCSLFAYESVQDCFCVTPDAAGTSTTVWGPQSCAAPTAAHA